MYKKAKYISIFVLLLGFTMFLSGCESGSAGTDSTTYRLNAQIAGIGTITDIDSREVLTGNQDVMYSDRYLRDDRVRLRAEGAGNSEFLFWADNNVGNIYNPRQDIRMNSNKNVMAVFGGEEVFLGGYIHESAQNKNVIGFWKTINNYPYIEIYVRDTRYSYENYRYFFDAKNVDSDPNQFAIEENDQGSDSEFIAAIYRIEQPDDDEFEKILFVYADITVFHTVILESGTPENENLFNDAFTAHEEGRREDFISIVRDTIYQNRNKDIIIGSTAWPFDGSSN